MTNFEYIMRSMKDTDLANYMAQHFDQPPVTGILAEADNAYWYQLNLHAQADNNRTTSVSIQTWLSKQYNEKEWREAQEN